MLTALWYQKDILHSFQKRFKKKLAGENAVKRLHSMEFARSVFKKWAPGNGYKIHAKKHKHITAGLKYKPDILDFS